MSAPPPATTRRTALGAALVGAVGIAATGCSLDALEPDGASPESGGASTPTRPAVDADQRLVDEVLVQMAGAGLVVVQAGDYHPQLKRELRSLRRTGEAHLRALGGYDGESARGLAGRTNRAEDRRIVLATEARLQRRLAAAAVRVQSGGLARLLASMSAGVAQQLAVLGLPSGDAS